MNKKLGNDFEVELCNILANNGFWCHNFASKTNGQPSDIIAVRDRYAYLIDAKVCSDGVFKLSRIEENQKTAMEYWEECGNGNGYFALKVGADIYFFTMRSFYMFLSMGKREINEREIREFGITLGDWL